MRQKMRSFSSAIAIYAIVAFLSRCKDVRRGALVTNHTKIAKQAMLLTVDIAPCNASGICEYILAVVALPIL